MEHTPPTTNKPLPKGHTFYKRNSSIFWFEVCCNFLVWAVNPVENVYSKYTGQIGASPQQLRWIKLSSKRSQHGSENEMMLEINEINHLAFFQWLVLVIRLERKLLMVRKALHKQINLAMSLFTTSLWSAYDSICWIYSAYFEIRNQ